MVIATIMPTPVNIPPKSTASSRPATCAVVNRIDSLRPVAETINTSKNQATISTIGPLSSGVIIACLGPSTYLPLADDDIRERGLAVGSGNVAAVTEKQDKGWEAGKEEG